MAEAQQPDTVWERIEAARAARPTLTHDEIAAAAMRIADAEGLNAVSMRRLARDLGVATMALYRYVSSKGDIVELMIDGAHAGLDLPEGDWRTVSRAYAEQARARFLRHPWLSEAAATTPNALTPSILGNFDHVLGAFDDLDIDIDSKAAIFATINSFVQGAVTGELAHLQDTANPQASSGQTGFVRWAMESGRFPRVTTYIAEGSNDDDDHWQFEFGLTCLLDGIAARFDI